MSHPPSQNTSVIGRLSTASPPLKIIAWIGVVAVLAGLIQGTVWLAGLPWNILLHGGGGRGVLLGLALGTLLLLMATDQRPATSYGFFVGRSWARLLMGGFALGAVIYGLYCGIALAAGAYRPNTELLTPGRVLGASLAALAAFPVALGQQVIFSGYLLSIFRERYGRAVSVIVPAMLFAVLYRIEDPGLLFSARPKPLVIGIFLTAALLGTMRLRTGSILMPSGFLAGCIFVRRIVRKTALLLPESSSVAAPWLAPEGDPRTAPVLWGLLALAVGVYSYRIARCSEGRVPDSQPAWDADFKRVFPLSNGSMLAPLDVWLPRLWQAQFRVGLKYIPRLLAILVVSSVNTVLTLPERLLLPLFLRGRRVRNPVFILGVHRSGTTHLHNLLALDSQFCTPRAYQIMNPAGFNVSGWLVAPLLGAFLPWKRPMDSVRFHALAPQEEEFALAGLSRLSPYWGLTFPRDGAAYDRYILPEGFAPNELAAWKRLYRRFLQRLTLFSGRRPLLKNPYNTGRVAVLREMFPQARFVHIYRHPFAVYRSNVHTAREGHIINQLQDPNPADNYETRYLRNYRAMEDAFYRDCDGAAANQVAEVRFEDLERDPIGQVERIYATLGMEVSPSYRRRLERYLAGVAGYQKNRFKPLPDEQRRAIVDLLGDYMHRWGYADDGGLCVPSPRKAA